MTKHFGATLRTALYAGAGLLGIAAATPALAQAQSSQQQPLPAPNNPTNADDNNTAAAGQSVTQPGSPTPAAEVPDIVVTAQKRSERVQNVPISITALNTQQLTSAGVSDLADLKAAAPALNVTTAEGGFGLPRIRGIGATGQGPGIENPVAVYVDGVYYGAAFGVLQSLFDVQQIAVLKGPQGTLFGRNATGGLIQVTTEGPTFDFHAKGQAGYGNYDTFDGAGYVSGGLSKTVAISLSGQYENRHDGFGTNIYDGTPVDNGSSFAARAKLLWQPSASTSFLLSGDVNGENANEPAFRQLSLNTNGQATPGDAHDINADVDPRLRQRQTGESLTWTQVLGFAKLKSITAYRWSDLRVRFDPDGTTLPFVRIDNSYTDKQFTQEVNLISEANGPLQWVIGAFYMNDKAANAPNRVTGIYQFGGNGYTDDIAQIDLDSYAGFAEGTWAIDPSTHLIAGLRYTSDRRTLNDENVAYNGNVGMTTTTPTNGDRTFDKLSWRLSFDHRFSPELLAYASYNRGFRSGSFVPGVGTAITLTLEPEVVDAYEVGIKSDLFDRKVRFNLAGYYYDQNTVQVQQIVAGVNNVYDANGAHIYGVDADVNWQVTRDFALFGGFSWTHARYKSFTDAVLSTPYPLPAGFVIPAGQSCLGTFGNPFTQVGGNCLLIGNDTGGELQTTPDFTASAGGAYDIPLGASKLTLAGNYYYNDGWIGSVDGRVYQKAYSLVDASITWRAPKDRYYVRLWAKNLTDTTYATQLSASNSGDNGTIGAPRTWGGMIGFNF